MAVAANPAARPMQIWVPSAIVSVPAPWVRPNTSATNALPVV